MIAKKFTQVPLILREDNFEVLRFSNPRFFSSLVFVVVGFSLLFLAYLAQKTAPEFWIPFVPGAVAIICLFSALKNCFLSLILIIERGRGIIFQDGREVFTVPFSDVEDIQIVSPGLRTTNRWVLLKLRNGQAFQLGYTVFGAWNARSAMVLAENIAERMGRPDVIKKEKPDTGEILELQKRDS